MPGPDRDAVHKRRVTSVPQPLPATDKDRPSQKATDREPETARQRPQPNSNGCGKNKQRRGNSHQYLMLDHMKRKQVFAQPMQRRYQRAHQCEPAACKGQGTPTAKLPAQSGALPENRTADCVKTCCDK